MRGTVTNCIAHIFYGCSLTTLNSITLFQITLGYTRYQYACLTYPDTKKVALIIGLTVGLGGFAIFLTILIICIVICRRMKVSKETDRPQDIGGQELRNRHNNNAVQPESHKDYGDQREQSDDYIKPNDDNYLTSHA